MAVQSLRYRPNAAVPEENKFGYVVFTGEAVEYHHWYFRTKLKLNVASADDFQKVMSNIIENLRGDALNVAMEIGVDRLLDPDEGADLLFTNMFAFIFPIARHESKALYREGHKLRDGVFCRQSGESTQTLVDTIATV